MDANFERWMDSKRGLAVFLLSLSYSMYPMLLLMLLMLLLLLSYLNFGAYKMLPVLIKLQHTEFIKRNKLWISLLYNEHMVRSIFSVLQSNFVDFCFLRLNGRKERRYKHRRKKYIIFVSHVKWFWWRVSRKSCARSLINKNQSKVQTKYD